MCICYIYIYIHIIWDAEFGITTIPIFTIIIFVIIIIMVIITIINIIAVITFSIHHGRRRALGRGGQDGSII